MSFFKPRKKKATTLRLSPVFMDNNQLGRWGISLCLDLESAEVQSTQTFGSCQNDGSAHNWPTCWQSPARPTFLFSKGLAQGPGPRARVPPLPPSNKSLLSIFRRRLLRFPISLFLARRRRRRAGRKEEEQRARRDGPLQRLELPPQELRPRLPRLVTVPLWL